MLVMKIKSFIAPSVEKAMVMVRSEIGAAAVILETRECEGRGFKGMLGNALVEVIAAYSEDAADDPSCKGGIVRRRGTIKGGSAGDGSVRDGGVDAARSRTLALLSDRKKEIDSKGTAPDVDGAESPGHDMLQLEVDRLRQYLVEQEVDSEALDAVFAGCVGGSGDGHNGLNVDNVKSAVRSSIEGMIETLNVEENGRSSSNARVISFVGPTGVGKTTTLAKIAARLAIDNKKDVGVITVDTYRIAAVDQLAAYAEMIDIPVRVAHTPKDLAVAVSAFKDKEFVLVDTVGRSQYDGKKIRMLRGLLKTLPSTEHLLVMSAGTGGRAADDIFENFNILPLTGVIFTKIDETKSYGLFLNMARKTKLPICYLTNGQEVPDDIMDVGVKDVADLVFP